MCFMHNKVNEKLGKPAFDCAEVDKRWDCGCNLLLELTPEEQAELDAADKAAAEKARLQPQAKAASAVPPRLEEKQLSKAQRQQSSKARAKSLKAAAAAVAADESLRKKTRKPKKV